MVNPLARAVLKNVSEKVDYSRPYIEKENVKNINDKDERLLKSIIKKEVEAKSSDGSRNIVTLDELAKKMKGSS